jgi:hypothetical protein
MRSLFKLGRAARAATMLCALAVALAAGAGSAMAATRFGSYGTEAGQFKEPAGVAADAEGNVYASDTGNHRVDKFDGAGIPLLAWGWGVLNSAEEAQTCTNACVAGEVNSEAGAFFLPSGVAVDGNPLSLSYGDVYVMDFDHARVEKFDQSGKFLLMFGGRVNKDGANVCVAGEACREGTEEGTGDGEFTTWGGLPHSIIAVGPGGAVYVGDRARVQVFEPSGAWRENVSLAGLSSTAKPSALTVDTAGDVYVKVVGVPGVRELEANGVEKGFQFDPGSESVTALALDSSGDLFVGDSSGGFHVLKYDSAGNELASFGSKTVTGETRGLAFSRAANKLYVPESFCENIVGNPCIERSSVVVLPSPPPGPVVDSESATPGLRGAVTFEAVLNPENHETTYHFEYVDQAHYESGGFAGASSTPSVALGSGFEDHALSAQAAGLLLGETYHYRVVAQDSLAHTTYGADQAFEETPAALIEGVSALDVSGTSATLSARIDPLGANTSYRWEYGTTSSYGHVYSGNVGEGMEFVALERHLQELAPATTYHYRLVASSEVGSVASPDGTFTTQAAGTELALLDGRAWELVSPADKKGALFQTSGPGAQAAALDGASITYFANYDVTGENEAAGKLTPGSQDISVHGPGGWRAQDIALSRNPPRTEESIHKTNVDVEQYPAFSPDLSQAIAKGPATLLSPEALEGTFYWRDNANGSFVPGSTTASVPSGTELVAGFRAATPDLTHVIVESPLALTKDAKPYPHVENQAFWNLYEEVRGGQIQLVNILPNGEQSPEGLFINLAGSVDALPILKPPISSDGRRVLWTLGGGVYAGGVEPSNHYKGLFLRDTVERKTVRIGRSHPVYQWMSSDGSRIFFLEGGDLYEYNADTGVETDLTADHGAGEASAGVQETVTDVSEDGSYVYFVAHGVLAKGGVSGEENLYLLHDGGSGWTTTHIATLSIEDEPDWFTFIQGGAAYVPSNTTRVSPDGRYLTFMSQRPLTGYDNIDAVSGRPDEEVYMYDAVADRLVCASCNPTGARPVGVFTGFLVRGPEKVLVAEGTGWEGGTSRKNAPRPGHWLAGSLSQWHTWEYQPRYLSDSGRLFFNSSDALVPADTNGREDVYEYEPAGVGSCTSASLTFSARSGGCVDLVSSGTSSAESAFIDASETGNDVFFMTESKLTAQDYDTAYDIYDAHVCSESLPCVSAPVSSPPCSSGDSCKAAPSAQPTIFGPAPSATFSGSGNLVEEAKRGVVKHKHKARRKHVKHKKRRAKRATRSRNGSASGKVRG